MPWWGWLLAAVVGGYFLITILWFLVIAGLIRRWDK